MRRPLIAGNWKMNGLRADALRWAKAAVGAAEEGGNEVALFPPSPWLTEVGAILGAPDGLVGLGGQACHTEPFGAFTGWVSAPMLADAGCRYVLCGHSERRILGGETDATVADALVQALEASLIPILCVGETFEQRRAHQARNVVLRMVDAGLDALPGPESPLLIAYEPVWAIGTGLTASPREASEAHGWIRAQVGERDADRARSLRILYGGSVKPGNIGGLLAASDVDGALVGGAALDPDAFAALVRATPTDA
ncbi:MAG: triose-phosphate isomerase [Planctomycetota bacterium]